MLALAYVPMAIEFEFDTVLDAATAAHIEVSAEAPWNVLTAVTEQLEIETIDFRPTLEQLHAGGQPLHLRGDAHYSAVVCRACGESLWAALQSQGLPH